LIFFSRQRIQAFPRTGIGGGVGSLIGAFSLDLEGDMGKAAFSLFLVDTLRVVVGETAAPFFLILFFADGFRASDDVNMSRAGSVKSFAASILSFLLRFLLRACFSSVAVIEAATPLSVASAGKLCNVSYDWQSVVCTAAEGTYLT
jgi:hypothetical protein